MADDPAGIDGDERDGAVAVGAQPIDQVGLSRLAERRRHDRRCRGDVFQCLVADERGYAALFLKLIFGPSRGSSHSRALVWPGGSDFWKAGRAQMRS